MKYHPQVKQRAIVLRRKGYSIKEIAKVLGISVGTSSLWLRDIVITPSGLARLEEKNRVSRIKGVQVQQSLRKNRLNLLETKIKAQIKSVKENKFFIKSLCAYLYWGEGNKTGSFVGFINSDPEMIRNFMFLLRSGFEVDETKFRGLMHLHEYHDQQKMANFWSQVSGIPLSRFSKTYIKPHTGKRKKKGYKGSLRIRYYDVKIAQELTLIYNTLSSELV